MNSQVQLIACSTCGSASRDERGRTEGERLLAQLERTRDGERHAAVELSSVRCLWMCKRSCAVHLRSRGRVGYVLADFDDSESSARGLLEYARMYGQSSDGAVPFKTWPDAVRGHFVCRTPVDPSHGSVASAEPDPTAPKETP